MNKKISYATLLLMNIFLNIVFLPAMQQQVHIPRLPIPIPSVITPYNPHHFAKVRDLHDKISNSFWDFITTNDFDLQGLNLQEAPLQHIRLCKANLSQSICIYANLKKAFLQLVNLYKANLTGANLHKAFLNNAELTQANFVGADLSYADLSGANLTHALLHGANLRGAILQEANLAGAKLNQILLEQKISANGPSSSLIDPITLKTIPVTFKFGLGGADLTDAILVGTNLTGVDLQGAILQGADLRGTIGLNEKQLAYAREHGAICS